MDGSSFDRAARAMAQTRSRRSALRLLAGTLIGGAVATSGQPVLADHKPKHCAKSGQKAHPHKGCCPGLVVGGDGRCIPDRSCDNGCNHLSTECTLGVCVNGECEAQPFSEGGECGEIATCTEGICADGACVQQPANEGEICDDGNPCTRGETCQSDGTCGGGTLVACEDRGPCQAGTCNEDTGECTYTTADDGTPCGDAWMCKDGTCAGPTGTPCDPNSPSECYSGVCRQDHVSKEWSCT